MGLRFKILAAIFLSTGATMAQDLGFGISNFIGTGVSRDLGMHLVYAKALKKNALNFELEMRSIDWGNQFNAGFGYKAIYWQKSKWQVGGISNLYIGMAPFHQKSFMAFGASYTPFVQRNSKGRLFYRGSLGFRYNICPGYAEYGNHQQLEFPLRVCLGFNLRPKD